MFQSKEKKEYFENDGEKEIKRKRVCLCVRERESEREKEREREPVYTISPKNSTAKFHTVNTT